MISFTNISRLSSIFSHRLCYKSISTISKIQIPKPQGKIQNVEDFLKTIGRGCDKYVSVFKDWDQLFKSSGKDLEGLGIPVKQRRWILNWSNKMKLGVEPYYIKPSTKGTKKKK
ncbi:hypothetical protein BB559_001335 [Furculomyces boomerangus]|uniref:Small ribosomal subunit protein mS41 n=2 Tax=Harpellales TaxID=61421 RepID=A0A2T9Z2C5_9FUNG|nr:hypothetical protein BB559_001335 [Furculomyces boomerangus]PVZ99038.1 hypothetical protein BB558_004955 [Smittium angustum]